MKKLFIATIVALAGILSVSCVQEHIDAQYLPDKASSQALGEIAGCTLAEDGPNISTTYKEVDFGLSVPTGYSLWVDIAGNNFEGAKKIDATISEGTISFGQKKFNKILTNMGAVPGEEFSVEFRLNASMLTDKGTEARTIYSNVVKSSFIPYEESHDVMDVVDVPGDYQGWKPAEYPKLFNYSYDGVLFRGVVDFTEEKKAGNGFKITYGGNWDSDSGNWGSPDQAEAAEADKITLINGDASQNIICYSAKRYYLFEFDKDALTLSKLRSFDQVGLIGLNGDWDNDVVMTYNMYYGRFWADVDLASDTEFKFRLDAAWDFNGGGNLEDLSAGGDNIPIAAGQYRIYFYMNDVTIYAEIDPDMYGKDEPTIGPEPEPIPTYQGWGIIGVGGDWENDIAMTEKDGVWTGYANLTASDEWKLRKDADWAENAGGTFEALDTPFAALNGGDNIRVGMEGFFKIVYDTNESTITVSNGTVWSLIGDFSGWSGDVDMTETEPGVWVSPATVLTPGWKVRLNHDWAQDFGGTFAEFDTPFEAVPGGSNIDCGDGTFVVTLNLNDNTITVSNAAKTWGVVGDFCGWGEDVDMYEVMPGVWVSPVLDLTGGWKVRYDNGWDIDRGGATPSEQGMFTAAVPGGENIALEGSFAVVYNANNETIGTLGFGITGSIASCGISWDKDIPMNLASDGKYYSIPVALTTADELKIRWNTGWDINRGGVCEAVEAEFDAVDGGENITVPADGTYMLVYDPANEKLMFTVHYWGLIGAFNGWGGDTYMLPLGEGKWAAYNQTLEGEWKFRMSSDWAVNFGGSFLELGTPFELTQDGGNISCEETNIAIVLDTEAATATISK
ncbi:MAG: SusE domain-containing protein [Bacteroidales bacterium]|nr:SusE domain-containing protein [Bacteroidales bacterium]